MVLEGIVSAKGNTTRGNIPPQIDTKQEILHDNHRTISSDEEAVSEELN